MSKKKYHTHYCVPVVSLIVAVLLSSTMALSSKIRRPAGSSRIVHMNHAGASPAPAAVTQRVIQHMQDESALGGYVAAKVFQDELDGVYRQAADLVHAHPSGREIALVESATVAWTRAFYAFAQHQDSCTVDEEEESSSSSRAPGSSKKKQQRRRVILVSEAEYAANVVAASQWARTHKHWTVLSIPSASKVVVRPDDDKEGKSTTTTTTGKVDLGVFRDMLGGRYRHGPSKTLLDPSSIAIVCVTHIPTSSGVVNPCEDIGRMIAEYNDSSNGRRARRNAQTEEDATSPPEDGNGGTIPSIMYIVDACQSVGQREVNVREMHCHALVATGRKYLRGPRGTGFLFVREDVCNEIMPSHVDHYGVPVTSVVPSSGAAAATRDLLDALPVDEVVDFKPRKGATRFEFWESNVANKLGLGRAIAIARERNASTIAATIRDLARELYERLRAMADRGVRVHYPPESGIVSFWVEGTDSVDVAAKLWGRKKKTNKGADDNDVVHFEVIVSPRTSTPLDCSRTGVPDVVRASLSYTNTAQEIDLFCEKLSSILNDDDRAAAAANL